MLSGADIAKAKAEIDDLRARFERAVADGDLAAMGTTLTEDAVMVRPAAADWLEMAAASAGNPFPSGAAIRITPIETTIVSDEWAYEFGNSVTTYTPQGAAEPVRLRDTYLVVFHNRGDGWRLHREVASASPPPGGWTNS